MCNNNPKSKFDLEDFRYATQFDTVLILKRTLMKDYEGKSEYPIKGLDISTLLLIGLFPNQPMSFYSYKLNLENGSFNYIANKIEKLGLVEIVKDEIDKRKKVLVLTEAGEVEFIEQRRNMNKHIENKLSILSEEDRNLFIETLNTARRLALKLVIGDVKYEQ